MAYKLVLSAPNPAAAPADGWIVGYKPLGAVGAYTVVGPFATAPIEITTADPVGTLYEGYIKRDCGALSSVDYFWQTPCNCTGAGYSLSPSGNQCQSVDTQPASVTNSGYCLAASTNNAYTEYSSRVYNPGFTSATLNLISTTVDANIYGEKTSSYWRNPGSTAFGPLNREGVWVDSNCDGAIDTLAVTATIACNYNNTTGANKTVFVGVGADNSFKLKVNGTQIVDSGVSGDLQFKIWHIMPVVMIPGLNYINVESTNAGGAQAVGLVIYDNTAAEIMAAVDDTALTIPFASHNLRGTTFDTATCASGYSLDTSSGSGNYSCKKTFYKSCNTLV